MTFRGGKLYIVKCCKYNPSVNTARGTLVPKRIWLTVNL